MHFLNNMIFYEEQHDKDSDYYPVGLNTDFVFPLHFHRGFELTLLPEGEMQLHPENEEITLKAGDMLFVGSNCIHDQLTVGSSKSLICRGDTMRRLAYLRPARGDQGGLRLHLLTVCRKQTIDKPPAKWYNGDTHMTASPPPLIADPSERITRLCII